MKTSSSRQRILNITLVALFAAIAYISLMLFFFPFGQMYIHFGNLVVVVAALLVGGWQGGLAGAVGMGLYDLFNGHADSLPKTLLLKFLIGFTVGLVFSFLKNRKKYPSALLFTAGIVSLLLAVFVLFVGLNDNGISIHLGVLMGLFIIIGISCIILAALKNRFSKNTAAAIAGAACGMLVNLLGEFFWKVFQFYIAGSTFAAACLGSATAQSSTLINAAISIIGGVALYCLLKKPFDKILNR